MKTAVTALLVGSGLLTAASAGAADMPSFILVDDGCKMIGTAMSRKAPKAPDATDATRQFYVCRRDGESVSCTVSSQDGSARTGGKKNVKLELFVVADESPTLVMKTKDLLNMVLINFGEKRFGWAQMLAEPRAIIQKHCSGEVLAGSDMDELAKMLSKR